MIDREEAQFLATTIEFETCLLQNSTEKAKTLCKTLNGMNLSVTQKATLNDTVDACTQNQDIQGTDALSYILNNLDCIENREIRVRTLEIADAIRLRDREKGKELLDRLVKPDMFEGTDNTFSYARSLITVCRIVRDYDRMEQIRQYLAEVK